MDREEPYRDKGTLHINDMDAQEHEVDLCDICQEFGESSEAEDYCSECAEALCSACTRRHAASKATKDHLLISIEERKSNTSKFKCNVCVALGHASQAIVFCEDCDEFFCKVCIKTHSAQKCTKQHQTITIDAYLNRDKKICDICAEEDATKWCKECTQMLCKNCSRMHGKQRYTKLHILIPVSDMPIPEIRDCTLCSLRKLSIPAEQYCPVCEELLCASCVSSHKTRKATQRHELVDMSEYSESKTICDVCRLSGENNEARYACNECDEKLCIDCKHLHTKQKATRFHEIIEVSSLHPTKTKQCDVCHDKVNDAVTFCKLCEESLCQRCTDSHKSRKATADHPLLAPDQVGTPELCEPCFEGSENITAESFCITCEEKLCARCAKSHQTQKTTKGHAICSIHDIPPLPINGILCGICPSDGDKGLAIQFCDTCDENICAECLKQHSRQKATKFHTITASPKERSSTQNENYIQTVTAIPSRSATLQETLRTDVSGQIEPVKEETPPKDNKKPGKPEASNIKADSLELTWTRPDAFTMRDSYQVRYKDLDHDNKWTFVQHGYSTSTCMLTDLKADTRFIFQVRMVQDDEEGPYSEQTEEIVTQPSPGGRLKAFSTIVEKGTPTKYAVPLTDLRYARCKEAKSKKFELGPTPQAKCSEKTIMLVGATGTGKSTLVDGLVNYILGVNWSDPFRYTIIKLEDEEQQRSDNQAMSQTEWITCYIINPEKGSRLDYRLNIIDTPGFGDTRGLQRDHEIVDQIRELFSATSDKGVAVIDSVCFLIKAPDARLTATQTYIFHAIMSLFGQDIEQNICSMITFADGQDPPVLASLEQSGLPFGKHFTFNNSGLFSKNTQQDSSSLSPMFWEMGVKSYRAFFDNLSKMSTRSLTLTKEVLEERQKLELTISSLQPQVDAGLSKVHALKKELTIVEQHQADIKDNKNFEYEVEETQQEIKELLPGHHVTNCLHCNITCHEDCAFADDADKKRCRAMDANGNCKICTNHCSWELHKNTPYTYRYVKKMVKRTYKEKLLKYKDASGKLLNAEEVLSKMYEEFEELEEGIESLMEEVNESNNRLKEIALRPNPLSMVEHIDLMVEAEKMEKKYGFQGRIEALMQYRKKAEITTDVERFSREAAGTRRKQSPKKAKQERKKFSFTAFLKKWNPFI